MRIERLGRTSELPADDEGEDRPGAEQRTFLARVDRAKHILGWTAAGLYLFSFGLPVVDAGINEVRILVGWEVAWMSLSTPVKLAWEAALKSSGPIAPPDGSVHALCLGSLVNVLLLTAAVLHRKLARTPRILAACLLGAVLAALAIPVWFFQPIAYGASSPPSAQSHLRDILLCFELLDSGYWCWLGSMVLALLAAIAHWWGLRAK